MRTQKQELEDEISIVIQQRCLNQVKTNSLKQEGYEVDATAEMTLTRELEQKKVELVQIQDQTSKLVRDTKLSPLVTNNIQNELEEVKNLVLNFNSAKNLTSFSDLKDLIPREVAKVKRELQQLDSEIAAINDFSQEMTNDLFKGVDVDDSKIMMEFMSDMKQESKKLKLETLRLQNERSQFQASLDMLSQLETMV